MLTKIKLTVAVSIVAANLCSVAQATIIPVQEDVLASAFFQGADRVRGFAGDNRNVHRVSNDLAFGVGPETIYLTFDAADFSGLSGPVQSAILSIESVSGGFGADAGSGNPFTVSAHAVDTDPIAAITDNTNPGGPIDWLDFFNNNILPADPAALTVVDSFGTVTFDVTAVVNDLISGANTVFTLALTGKNDLSGNDFLHGFLNNTENPGSTFLTVNVPEPTSLFLGASAIVGLLVSRRRLACK